MSSSAKLGVVIYLADAQNKYDDVVDDFPVLNLYILSQGGSSGVIGLIYCMGIVMVFRLILTLAFIFQNVFCAPTVTISQNMTLGSFTTADGSTSSSNYTFSPSSAAITANNGAKVFINPTNGVFRIDGIVAVESDFPLLVQMNAFTLGSYITVEPNLAVSELSSGVSCNKVVENSSYAQWCCYSVSTGYAIFKTGGKVSLSNGFISGFVSNSGVVISANKNEVTC